MSLRSEWREDQFVNIMKGVIVAKDPSRVSEGDMVLPALEALAVNKAKGLSTSELISILRDEFKPHGRDIEISPYRNDDYFSEKVRNLKSHNNLTRKGLATYNGKEYQITKLGEKFVSEVAGARQSFIRQGFTKASVTRTVVPEKSCVFIEEGQERIGNKTIRLRSNRLREAATKKFKNSDGTIICHGCGFEGSMIYGENGKALIEIHHIRPISTKGETKEDIEVALKNVAPLCPNCHRVVHRKAGVVLELRELQKILKPKSNID